MPPPVERTSCLIDVAESTAAAATVIKNGLATVATADLGVDGLELATVCVDHDKSNDPEDEKEYNRAESEDEDPRAVDDDGIVGVSDGHRVVDGLASRGDLRPSSRRNDGISPGLGVLSGSDPTVLVGHGARRGHEGAHQGDHCETNGDAHCVVTGGS